jgi:predicted ArsR family transcriptional regulator
MSDKLDTRSAVQVISVKDIDDELLNEIMNAKWGEMSVGKATNTNVADAKDARIERLEDIIYAIAVMADNHKASRLYVENENVALVNIRNMAALTVGMDNVLRERGNLISVPALSHMHL